MSDPLEGVRILVVEDNADTRELLKVLLETHGCDVMTAASVQEAVSAYDHSRPHVIVADIEMPDLNGYALIGLIRARDRERGNIVPAIALTAYATPIDRDTMLSAGFQVHMPKPFEPGRLVSVISELAAKYPSV
jgi:CheY-like chemotaxis protein